MENQFIFTRPLSFELKDNGDLMISLDISTTEPDLVNDIVTLDFLKSMQSQILMGNKKLDIEHEAFRGKSVEEKEINKTKVPAGRMMDPVITEYKNEKKETHYSLNIKGLINKFRNDYENIKGNIIEKFLDAGSIAFIPTKFRREEKGGIVYRYLEDGVLLNTALTGNPINTSAQMRAIISKSLDSLEEYQKSKNENPAVEGLLEVKSKESEKIKNEKEEPEETDENKKKKEEEMKKECKDHNHLSDSSLIKLKEVKNMEGDNSTPGAPEVKADAETKAELEVVKKSNAELKSELEIVKSKLAELDASVSKAVPKSKPEVQQKNVEVKSYPLDLFR
jgi:hypothetical protein